MESRKKIKREVNMERQGKREEKKRIKLKLIQTKVEEE